MFNKLFRKVSMAVVGIAMAVGVGVGFGVGSKKGALPVRAEEGDLAYTMTTPKSTGNTAYGSTYDVTIDGITWNAPGNQNFDNYWRIGGKNLSNVSRVLTGKTAISKPIKKITISHSGKSNNSFTLNSVSVTVASDSSFETVLETRTVTPSISTNTAGTFDITASTTSIWAKDSYYKFSFVCSNSTNSNYGLNLASIAFYEGYTPADVPTKGTLAISPVENNTLNVGQSGTFSYTLSGGSQTELSTASWRSSDSSVVEITNSSTGAYNVKKAGSATIYLSGTDADSFVYDEVSYSITAEIGAAGTKYNPYDVVTALTKSGENGVYTKGYISRITSVDTGYGNATYYISDDGTETNELEIFRGKYLNNVAFTSSDQIQVGDRVIVYGNITTYNDTVEYAQNNYLVELKSEARLTLSPSTIEVTVGTEKTVTASPSNFEGGTVTYAFDENDCATLSYEGNTITIHGDKVGDYEFTVTGKAGGVDQASAKLTVNVVEPYPTNISRSGYASYTDTQTFAQGTGSLTITYSDSSTATKHLGDEGVKLLISDAEVPASTSTAAYVGSNSAKISYTEQGHTVTTNAYALNVTVELSVDNFEKDFDYLLTGSSEEEMVTVNFTSINGEPDSYAVVSSNPSKLNVSEALMEYDSTEKTGTLLFGLTPGNTQGAYTVTASVTKGERTESKSLSVVVRGEAPAPAGVQYERIATLDEVTSGKYVIAANVSGTYYALGSIASGRIDGSAVTVSDGVITEEDAGLLPLDITRNSNTVSISKNGSYLKIQTSGTDFGTPNTTESFFSINVNSSVAGRGTFSITNTRALAFRAGSTNKFGNYATSNITASGEYYYVELFKQVSSSATKEGFDYVQEFVDGYMYMNTISINDKGNGACKGENGYYLTAKRAWNAMITTYNSEVAEEDRENLQNIFQNSFEDAYARYMAWADACEDTAPFTGTVIQSVSRVPLLGLNTENGSVTAIIVVVSLVSITAAGAYFFIRKRKEQ